MKTGQRNLIKPSLLTISIYALFIAGLLGLYVTFIDYFSIQVSLSSICSSIFFHPDVLMSAIIIIYIALCAVVILFIRKMAASACVVPIILIDFLLVSLAYVAWTNQF